MINKTNLNLDTLKNENKKIINTTDSLSNANKIGEVYTTNTFQSDEIEDNPILKDKSNENLDDKLLNGKKLEIKNIIRGEKRDFGFSIKDREYISAKLRNTDSEWNFENYTRLQKEREIKIEQDGPPHELKKWYKYFKRKSWRKKQRKRVEDAVKVHEKFIKMISSVDQKKQVYIEELKNMYTEAEGISEDELQKRIDYYKKAGTLKNYVVSGKKQEDINELTEADKNVFNLQLKNDYLFENFKMSAAESASILESEEDRVFGHHQITVFNKLTFVNKPKNGPEVMANYTEQGIRLVDLEQIYRDLCDVLLNKVKLSWDSESNNEEKTLGIKQFIEKYKKVMKWDGIGNQKLPEELLYLDENATDFLAKGNVEKFNGKEHLNESFTLLISAVSNSLYSLLNSFGGKVATDDNGQERFYHADDMERKMYNFDLLDTRAMRSILEIRNSSFAASHLILENRKKISDISEPELKEKIKDERNKDVLEKFEAPIAKDIEISQKGYLDDSNITEKKELTEEEKQAKKEAMYKEWREVILNGYEGKYAVDKKDMQQIPWVIKDYADQLIDIMKKNPEKCGELTGVALWKYLEGINENVNHNLKQLNDEVFKGEVGKYCHYVPKIMQFFKDFLIKDVFSLFMVPNVDMKNQFLGNAAVMNYFNTTPFRMVRNRQQAIMDKLNEEIGVPGFFENPKQLEKVWQNEKMQDFLCRDFESDMMPSIEVLSRNQILTTFGTLDEKFKNDIEKIQMNIRTNMNSLDDKIESLDICDTARMSLRKNLVLELGPEYLFGYSHVNESIVEYSVGNLMAYDGESATIQRRWEKFFNKSSMPSSLSSKVERKVAANVASNAYKKQKYYLKAQPDDASEEVKDTQKKYNDITKKLVSQINKVYKDEIKDFFEKELPADTKLTKEQWDRLSDVFDDIWLQEYGSVYNNKNYKSNHIESSRNSTKQKLEEELKKIQKEKVYDEETLYSLKDYREGLKSNKVIEYRKHMIDSDFETYLLEYGPFKDILKNRVDRDTLKTILNQELKNQESPMHQKYPYLQNIGSIEEISKLGMVDYNQFFIDMRYNLSGLAGKNTKDVKRLALDKWTKTTWAGSNLSDIKDKLLRGMLSGEITSENYDAKLAKFKEEVLKDEEIKKMRIDVFLDRRIPKDDYFKYSYLKIQGHATKFGTNALPQPERVRRCNYAKKLWENLAEYDNKSGGKTQYVKWMSDIIASLESKLLNEDVTYKKDRTLDKVKKNKKVKESKRSDFKSKDYRKLLKQFAEAVTVDKNGKLTSDFSDLFDNKLVDTDTVFGSTAEKDFITFNKIIQSVEVTEALENSKDKLKFEDYIAEFLMLGLQNELIGEGKRAEESFLAYKDEDYIVGILNSTKEVIANKRVVEEALKAAEVDEETRKMLLRQLEPVIAGLVAKDPQKNLEQYGVSGVMDLAAYLVERYGKVRIDDTKRDEKGQLTREEQERVTNEYNKKAVRIQKARTNAIIYECRKAYLDSTADGKFKLVREFLFNDPKQFANIMTCTDDEFYEYVKDLDKTIGVALSVFNSDTFKGCYPINVQYVMLHYNELFSHPDWDKDEWAKHIDGFYKTFMESKIPGRKSIEEMLSTVEKSSAEERHGFLWLFKNNESSLMHMKLSYIMQADPSSFTILYRERDIVSTLKNFDKRRDDNYKYMKDVLKEAAEKTGQLSDDDKMLKSIYELFEKGEAIRKKKARKSVDEKLFTAEQRKEYDEENLTYANFALAEQVFYSYCATVEQNNFKKSFIDKCKYFMDKVDEVKMPEIDRTYLDAKGKVQLGIEIRKQEGKIAEKEFFAKQLEYREERDRLGSPIMLSYGRKEAFDQKSISKAKDKVKKIYENEKVNPFIIELLTERYLTLKGEENDAKAEKVRIDKIRLEALEKQLRNKKGENDKPLLNERDIRKALVYAYSQNAIINKKPFTGTDDGDVDRLLDEYKERQKIKLFEKPKSGLSLLEYEEFSKDMEVAFYTMNLDDYKQTIETKKKYFDLLDSLCAVIDERDVKIGIKTGLLDYFKKDIFVAITNTTSVEEFENSIREQIDKLIGDKVEKDGDISAEDIKRYNLNYIENSSSVLGQVSDKSVDAIEKLSSTKTYTRNDMEKLIESCNDEELITYYNRLTVEEQKVFAIALSFPDMSMSASDMLGSNLVFRDSEKDRERSMELQNQLSAYIYDKKFAPKIDYNLVMRRLQKQDKKTGLMRMSKTVFNNALTYTKFCMKKRLDVMPKDFKRMGDGSFTLYQGRMLQSKATEADKLQETLENATITGTVNFQKFFEKFAELDSKHNKNAMSLFKKMAELTDVQVYMLVLILQDRTAIDYKTQDGWIAKLTKKGVDYANIEKREQLKEELIRAEGMDKDFMRDLALTVTPEQFQKAAETMFSFQLRDDINLYGKSVGVSDFKKGALDRKTAVDWDMLHEAFNLLEEIESQNLKIQACRETVKHTGDPEMANKNARNAYKELEKYVKEENGTTDLGYFDDFIVREAKKNPDVAMPLISSFYKLSANEKLLLFHALKHRDILDVSTEHTISTAIGLGEMDYVNAKGRDKLADYYIDHLSIAGAVNKITTWDKDVYDAMRSLLSSQIDDTKDVNSVKTYADLVKDNVGTTRFVRRDTAVDWTLFANALKFVKRTETERQIFIGNKELYRSQGELSKYGRFQYNYKYLRQNMYSSGNRFTRFLGRRLKDEIMDAIPFSGPAQNILMGILSQENRNKMLEMGIVEDEEAKKKDKFTKIAGYGAMAGEKINMLGENSTISSFLKMSDNVAGGFSIAGEAIADYSKIMSGIWTIGNKFGELSDIKNAAEKSEKFEERDKKRTERAKQIQSQAQQKVTENIIERNKHILKDVAGSVAQEAKREDILDTVSEFVETLSGTGVGEKFIEDYLFDKITNVVNEALKVTQFIMRLFVDKNMLKHYYDDDGPLADEANKLRTEGLKLRLQEQEKRRNSKKSILKDSELTAEDLKILENKSNVEIMQQAYGFSDFSEHAAYVGWNIVQTLIFTASPYNSNLQTKFQSFIIMTALGLKDLIGKQDNDTASKVFEKLMNKDLR